MPVATVREANSKLLYAIDEIMELPAGEVQLGTEIRGPLGLTMRLVRFEPLGNESCAVFQDTGARRELHLGFTFCPGAGILRKLEFSGEYHEFGDSIVREHVTLELIDAFHNQKPTSWLLEPEAQQGVLRAYLISNAAAPNVDNLEKLLRTGPPEVQALALAVYYQKKISPSPELLAQLSNSPDAEVQRIALRFAAKSRDELPGPCALPPQHYLRQKPGTTLRSMTTSSFDGTPYMMHVPIDYRGDEPFPLLIYLSGGGGQAFDGALTAEDVLGHSGYLAVYPHASGAMWWEQKPTAMVHDLLLETLRTYNVDSNRVYLAGFSNGATGALHYGTLWPERFAAIALLMGAGIKSPSGEEVSLKNLSNVPLLLLHGDKDPIIPSSASVMTYDQLRASHPRVAPELHILKGRGHELTLSSDDGFSMPFLERFRREPFPPSIYAKVTDLNFPRRYWVEILEKDTGPAEVEGHILPGNTIDLKTRNVRKLRLLLRPELLQAGVPLRILLNGREQPPAQWTMNCELFAQSAKTYADTALAYDDGMVVDVSK
jgi:pimeloyl-ACP methyl ester carboxylesterase